MASSNVWHHPVPHKARIFLKTLGMMVAFRGIGSYLNLDITSDLSLTSIKRLPALDMTSFEPKLMGWSAIIRCLGPQLPTAPQSVQDPS